MTAVSRVDTSGIYYRMTALNPQTAEVYSALTLPRSMRILSASYLDMHWAFTVEASYDSASAIAQVGTYYEIGDGRWFRCSRASLCTPSKLNGYLAFKYNKGTALVDVAGGTYFRIPSPDNSWDYGDYLAVSGTGSYVTTYATVDPNKDVNSAYVLLNIYQLNQYAM